MFLYVDRLREECFRSCRDREWPLEPGKEKWVTPVCKEAGWQAEQTTTGPVACSATTITASSNAIPFASEDVGSLTRLSVRV